MEIEGITGETNMYHHTLICIYICQLASLVKDLRIVYSYITALQIALIGPVHMRSIRLRAYDQTQIRLVCFGRNSGPGLLGLHPESGDLIYRSVLSYSAG